MVLPSERSSKSSKLPKEPSTSVPSVARRVSEEPLSESGNASPLTKRLLEVPGSSQLPPPSPPRPLSTVSVDLERSPMTSEHARQTFVDPSHLQNGVKWYGEDQRKQLEEKAYTRTECLAIIN